MPEGNGAPPDGADIPDPLRRAMQVHAHLQSEAAWWIFGLASYAIRPGPQELVALGDFTRDLMQMPMLIEEATKDFVQWVEEIKKARAEESGDA